MSQCKRILIYRFPRLVAEAFGFGIVSIVNLSFFVHRAAVQTLGTIFFGEVFI